MSCCLIIFYDKMLLMFLPLLYHFPLSKSVRAFYHMGPLPGSEELCLSEALTTVFSARSIEHLCQGVLQLWKSWLDIVWDHYQMAGWCWWAIMHRKSRCGLQETDSIENYLTGDFLWFQPLKCQDLLLFSVWFHCNCDLFDITITK